MPYSATNLAFSEQSEVFAPGHLGELTSVIPPEMVDAAIGTAGTKEHRLRRLPSRVVVYLLLAGALFAEQGWQHVWSRLSAGIAGVGSCPAKSALTQAMRRVGPGPLRELFEHISGPTACLRHQAVRFAGRMVAAIDGTQIPVPDTEANRLAFPKPRGGPNGEPGYPMARVLALVATGSRSVIDAVFGPDTVGELTYASRLTRSLKPGMLLLADRNFATYRFFAEVADTGADFLIRAKTGHGAMKLPVLARCPDGSYLSRSAQGLRVRVIEASVTITTETSTRTGDYRLITTLLDPDQAPAEELIGLYHHRWQIETAYCELKSTILGGRVLRARYPAGVVQELWALLCTYQALRAAMSDAILHRHDLTAERLSFTAALLTARDQIITTTSAISTTTIDLIGKITAALLANLLPKRGPRTRPRVTKRAISKYRAKGRDIDRRTYPATLHTTILTPDPDP